MQDVIIDRPRSGSRYKYKDFRRRPEGALRGMAKPYGYDRKSQSDVLGPLRGFLRSKVGCPWDDVWSEICDKADARTVIGSHLRDHVRYMVSTNVVIQNGEIISKEGGYRLRFSLSDHFYVHPETGILCYVPKYKVSQPEKKSNIIRYHGLEFYQHEGIWYQVHTRQISEKERQLAWTSLNYSTDTDVFGNRLHSYSWNDKNTCFAKYGEAVYIVSKKQIGKRMIKKIEKFINQ